MSEAANGRQRVWVRTAGLLGLLLLLVGCGDGGSDGGRSDARPVPEASLLGPGTPLVPGFVTPPGTHLVGSVFPRPVSSVATGSSSEAVLDVDGNPFAAWDHLADQAHAGGAGLPHSGVCMWRQISPLPSGVVPDAVSVAEPRPPGADTLVCEASATGTSPDGRLVGLLVYLWWGPAGAELGVHFNDDAATAPNASYPEVDPGPAPASAVGELPPRDDNASPLAGEPFGRENNCFEAGYGLFRLPEGARLVGGGTAPVLGDFAAVLAVSDAETVMAALRSQLDSPDIEGGTYDISSERTADGDSIWVLSGGADSGGACTVVSNPDADLLLVTTSSD